MADKIEYRNYLTIDYRDGFIRVGKGVVRSLNKPEYISLMINEDKMTLAIMAANKQGVMTFKVPEGFLTIDNKSFRIYSKGFVGIIADLLKVESKNTFRIKLSGHYDADFDAVVFELRKVI